MVNTNIPQDDWVSFAVNICIVIGVLLTFPLQIYPVIEMLEVVLFSEGKFLLIGTTFVIQSVHNS